MHVRSACSDREAATFSSPGFGLSEPFGKEVVGSRRKKFRFLVRHVGEQPLPPEAGDWQGFDRLCGVQLVDAIAEFLDDRPADFQGWCQFTDPRWTRFPERHLTDAFELARSVAFLSISRCQCVDLFSVGISTGSLIYERLGSCPRQHGVHVGHDESGRNNTPVADDDDVVEVRDQLQSTLDSLRRNVSAGRRNDVRYSFDR